LEGLVVAVVFGGSILAVLMRRSRLEMNMLVIASIVHVVIFTSVVIGSASFGLIVRQKMQAWLFVIFLIFAVTPVVAKPAGTARRRVLDQVRIVR
jgi:hypothetical protein